MGAYDEDEEYAEYAVSQAETEETETAEVETTESETEEATDEATDETAEETETAENVSDTVYNVLSTATLVDKNICDFNRDGKFNAKDRLYLSTHLTMTAPSVNNRTHPNRVLISAYN